MGGPLLLYYSRSMSLRSSYLLLLIRAVMRFLVIPMNEKLPTEALAIGRRGYKPEGAGV